VLYDDPTAAARGDRENCKRKEEVVFQQDPVIATHASGYPPTWLRVMKTVKIYV
jgi:hypothetical protein